MNFQVCSKKSTERDIHWKYCITGMSGGRESLVNEYNFARPNFRTLYLTGPRPESLHS